MAIDGKSGPEASAILSASAEEPRTARMANASQDPSADDSEAAPARQQQRKRPAEVGAEEAERKKKIERLTDLCDRLLQRGVLVYDSMRELLAIEVRERKGEQLRQDGAEEAASPSAPSRPEEHSAAAESKGDVPAAQAEQPAAGAGTGQVLFENRRYQSPDGQPAGMEAAPETLGTPLDATPLLWQYRWKASPEQIHGPFDAVTMHGWVTQACFAEERPAEVRQCDLSNEPLEGCWHRWSDVNFSLYL